MLAIKKIQQHYFFSEDSKTALKEQIKFYMVCKFQKNEIQCQKEADNYVDNISKKLQFFLERGLVDKADSVIENSKIFNDMQKTFENDEIVDKFDYYIVKKIKNKKEAFGYFNIVLDNQMNSKKDFRCDRIYKALFGFRDNNILESQIKLTKAFKTNHLERNNEFSEIINDSKQNVFLQDIADAATEFLKKMQSPISEYILDKLEFVKEFCNFIFDLTVYIPVKISKKAVKTYSEIEEIADLKLELRREKNKAKRKSCQTLKYKMN